MVSNEGLFHLHIYGLSFCSRLPLKSSDGGDVNHLSRKEVSLLFENIRLLRHKNKVFQASKNSALPAAHAANHGDDNEHDSDEENQALQQPPREEHKIPNNHRVRNEFLNFLKMVWYHLPGVGDFKNAPQQYHLRDVSYDGILHLLGPAVHRFLFTGLQDVEASGVGTLVLPTAQGTISCCKCMF